VVPGGHLRVQLRRGGVNHVKYVHGLVAEAFVGPRPEGLTVNHRDFDPANNHWMNLEYLTRGENTKYSWRAGRMNPTGLPGEAHRNAVLTDEHVLLIRERYQAGAYIRALARDYGVSQRTIQFIVRGERWSHLPIPLGARITLPPPVMAGERHGCAKLRNDDVVAIRQRVAAGERRSSLAQEYGVSLPAIDKIVNRRTWQHV
jgi:Mor family transcriptional regulator